MDGFSLNLIFAAVGIGVLHTMMGPDHYIPFLMLGRARRWGKARTLTVAGLCGVAHVIGSILLGVVGLAIGVGIGELERVDQMRGDWAAWLLVALGLSYAIWGVRVALRRSKDLSAHEHGGHVHIHRHSSAPHKHEATEGEGTTFWALLIVFILGPCEPLVPLFILPASRGRWDLALATALVFGAATVLTMICMTALGMASLERVSFRLAERWGHAIAGTAVAASGIGVIAFQL